MDVLYAEKKTLKFLKPILYFYDNIVLLENIKLRQMESDTKYTFFSRGV